MNFPIFCPACNKETSARKVYGPDLFGRAPRWWNRCSECRALYEALPPKVAITRRRRRMYEKRSGQLLLGGGF